MTCRSALAAFSYTFVPEESPLSTKRRGLFKITLAMGCALAAFRGQIPAIFITYG